MLSEQIRGIANHIIVGLLIDNKIIRLLYPIANEVEKLEDNLERIDGERVQFGDRVAYLECFNQSILTENRWMRREIERVGRALYTGTETGYVGTEEDLHAIGQFVEGVCENNERLFPENKALIEYMELLDTWFGYDSEDLSLTTTRRIGETRKMYYDLLEKNRS